MGRPIPQKYMGDFNNDGKQIKVEANFGSGVVDAWLVQQKSNREYWVENSNNRMFGILVPHSPEEGEIRVPVHLQSKTEYAWNISDHTVKTFEGGYHSWHFEAPDGEFVQIENA